MIKISGTQIELPNGDLLKSITGDVSDGGIVESGSNANGSWTKWADGTMICEKYVEVTTAISTSEGSCYRSGSAFSMGTYPQEFTTPPIENITVGGTASSASGAWILGTIPPTTTTGGSVYLFRGVTSPSNSYSLKSMAKGRWKA